MRRNFTVLALVLSLFFITTSLFSAGIDLTGVGAKAQALGGNFRAVADDWSAMNWNPAGMVFSKGFTVGMSSELITPVVGYTAGHIKIGTESKQFSTTIDEEVKNESRTFFVPSGGIYYSTGKYAFGLGVWAPFGLGAKWDMLHTQSYNKTYPEFDYDDEMQIVDIHPTFAYKINDKFSVGLGASIIMATIEIQKPNFTPNPYVFNPALAQIAAAIQATGALNSQYNHLLTDTKLEGDGGGFGFNIGAMYKATEDLSIGASLQYYNDLKLDGTVNAKTYFADNAVAHQTILAGVKPTLDAMLAGGLLTPDQYGVMLNYYSGASMDKTKDQKVKADMPLPMRAGIGVAYTGITNLLISADLAWTQWSAWGVIPINDEDGEKVSELTQNWEDGIRVGLGCEYTLPIMKLRLGYYTEPNAGIDETVTPSIPDFSRRHSLALGAMVPLGPVNFHASYEKIISAEKEVTEWVPTADGLGYDNMAGTYNMGTDCIMFGLDYIF
ncbi:MAG TPA: outer membrane protein transport protein [bacterium]|nr:outer membrane protein transport protein [bacterium]HPN42443.1 outer membrane protein transport protein [bacterium]